MLRQLRPQPTTLLPRYLKTMEEILALPETGPGETQETWAWATFPGKPWGGRARSWARLVMAPRARRQVCMPEQKGPRVAAWHLHARLPAHASAGQWGIPLAHNKTTYFCFYDNRKPGHHARHACLHMHAVFGLKQAHRQQQPRRVVVSCVTDDF